MEHVVLEALGGVLHVEFLEDHVAHGHGQSTVGTGVHAEPFIGKLRVVRIIGGNRDNLLAVVAGLGHEVRIGSTRQRQVRAPHDEVLGVEPVAGLGDVGLVAENLRRGDGEVCVPIVEGKIDAADELQVAGTCTERHHRHCGKHGEAGDTVRTPVSNRRNIRRGDNFHCLFPGGAHQSALASSALVSAGDFGIGSNRAPCLHGITQAGLGLAIGLKEG